MREAFVTSDDTVSIPVYRVNRVAGALVRGLVCLREGFVTDADCLLSVPAGASSVTIAAVGADGRCSHLAGVSSARLPRLVMCLVALQLLCGVLVVPSAARGALRVPVLRWVPCHPGFECASARAPLDYRDPGGSVIRLAVIRHRASDPAHRLGALFFNPGGPGGSGTALLPQIYRFFPAALRARFDIVSWDPRGWVRAPRCSALPRSGPRCASSARCSPPTRRFRSATRR